MDDMIQVDLPADEATLRKLGEAAMTVAARDGCAKLAEDVFIYDNAVLIEHQKNLPADNPGKSIDYTAAPFWVIVLNHETNTSTASPCHDPMEVVDFLDKVTER